MRTIEVDFDVFKALTLRRPSESVTENDVLREVLGIGPKRPGVAEASDKPAAGDWVTKGVHFPQGTEFRAHYKGQTFLARVEGGALLLNGKSFDSPSAAAVSITNNPVNGWHFWQCRLPGQSTWLLMQTMRK
jgi:hypothetical protein